MKTEMLADKQTYLGLFSVTLATLMHEILLTRIFSVTMWYHFAFFAVSVAMFGMTVGAILVYLKPAYFRQERVKFQLALTALLFSFSVIVSLILHLKIPFVTSKSITGVCTVALTYFVISIPFVWSGICVCLALTRFPKQVSKLYAADLSGAAVGCVLLIYVLNITDGPTAILIVAFIACGGALCFCANGDFKKLKIIALASGGLLAGLAITHGILVHRQAPWLRLKWVKGERETPPLYERWNSFSRIRISGNPNEPEQPFGWGLSSVYPSNRKIRQLSLNIDANAATMLTAFDGNLTALEHLKYDITNIAHYLRRDSKVLVVGTGGGRDILSALIFKQKSVLGVEINPQIIDAVNNKFGDFTGHLDRNPRVRFITDEARSYIARQKDKFDIIQVSLIDTWAATAAGAFVLTENSLYTVEAWKILMGALTRNGVLTFSRWYSGQPREMYRLTALAAVTLKELGIDDPRSHIIIVRHLRPKEVWGVGSILVSRETFSNSDVATIKKVARQLKFELVLGPDVALDPTYISITSRNNFSAFAEQFPIRINPPTDDSPFFFQMLRFRNVFNRQQWQYWWADPNMKAVFILVALAITVSGLTILCIIIPLIVTSTRSALRDSAAFVIFFASIGFGFMSIEISQMQRLIIFLGHPTYSLSVVLFALLLSSAGGSYYTRRLESSNPAPLMVKHFAVLLSALFIFGVITPTAINFFAGSSTPLRILVALLILSPLGFFMGMAFPLGMRIASRRADSTVPWLWGINGATSVCASVFTVAIALGSGISTAFWAGFLCYAIATLALAYACRRTANATGIQFF